MAWIGGKDADGVWLVWVPDQNARAVREHLEDGFAEDDGSIAGDAGGTWQSARLEMPGEMVVVVERSKW